MTTKNIPRKTIKKINKRICNIAPGIYSDEYWSAIKNVHNELDKVISELGLYVVSVNAQYKHGEDGIPNRKEWITVIRDKNERKAIVIVMACGAGSVKDPLEKYDVVAYAT